MICNANCHFILSPGCNRKEREGGDHKVALRQKKLKAKTFKWRSNNCRDMNGKVEAGGSDEVYDDTALCSLSTASFSSLVSRKRVRTLGKVSFCLALYHVHVQSFAFLVYEHLCVRFAISKVAEQCDAIDPPVPRKLRSGTN